jgi:hypothetical protein
VGVLEDEGRLVAKVSSLSARVTFWEGVKGQEFQRIVKERPLRRKVLVLDFLRKKVLFWEGNLLCFGKGGPERPIVKSYERSRKEEKISRRGHRLRSLY